MIQKAIAPTLLAMMLSLASAADASVAGWGENTRGEIGSGYRSAPQDPVGVVGLPSNVVSVVAAGGSSYALLSDGTLRAWGGNVYGQLGDGTHVSSKTPVVVKLAGVTQVAASRSHVIARLSDGTVATWGSNLNGELGNGTTTKGKELPGDNSPVPLIVPGLKGVAAVATGGPDNVALLTDGTLRAWGQNAAGEVGDGTTVEKTVPTVVNGASGVKAVAIGGFFNAGGHMLALLANGTVSALGVNYAGQLGNGSTTNSLTFVPVKGLTGITAVSADSSYSFALREDGTAFTWGSDAYDQLGVAAGVERCGNIPCSRVPLRLPLEHVTSISAGFRYGLAIISGKLFGWGLNEVRQLGDGTTTMRRTPTPVLGLGDAVQVSAGVTHAQALLQSAPPIASISITPGVGSLTLAWIAGTEPKGWHLSWRPVTTPRSPWSVGAVLPAGARSYTFTGLAQRPYDIRVQNVNFGAKVLTGMPGPAPRF